MVYFPCGGNLLFFKKMKKIIQRIATSSLLFFLLAPLATFAATTDGTGTGTGSTGFQLSNDYNLPAGTITGIVTNLLNWLLVLFGVFGVLGFVISGIIYLVSTGDDTMITRAKTAMMWSIVGIIVGLAGYVIMQAVVTFLGGSDNTF